jgi:ElaB/YqjD/DUF883 family membrane-anchored ribosome-binding protein
MEYVQPPSVTTDHPGLDGLIVGSSILTMWRKPMTDDPIRKELDALKADIAQLREDILGLTTAVRDVASDKAEKTRSDAKEGLRNVWEDLESKLDEVIDQGKSTMGNVQTRIGQHPTGSLLTAFGVGFIIAKLLDTGGKR